MPKARVYELAKELGVDSKTVLEKLKDMGESVAYEQVMQAVSDFEKGNMRLSTVLAALNA